MLKKLAVVLTSAFTLLSATLVLPGCAAIHADAPALYDLGAYRTTTTGTALADKPPIIVADVTVPAWIDNDLMYFRLNYANQQQPRPYATTRWTMTPGDLLEQQVQLRIAQAGGIALSSSDGASGVPILRIQVDDYSQHFDSPQTSVARMAFRATVLNGRNVLAQRTFVHEAPAPSPDAAGGAQALAVATDAALSALIDWLARLDLK